MGRADAKSFQDINGSQQVNRENQLRVGPSLGDKCNSCKVDACVRRDLLHYFLQAGLIPQIADMQIRGRKWFDGFDGVERDRRVTSADLFIYDVSAHKPASACHKDSHNYAFIWAL